MALYCKFLANDDQRTMGKIFELEARVEWPRVVRPASRLTIFFRQDDRDGCQLAGAYDFEVWMHRVRFFLVPDEYGPSAVGYAMGREARRSVDWTHLHARIRCGGCRVESGIFDVVAHQLDPFFTERFDVHQGPTVGQPELPVFGTVQPKLEVEELVGCSDFKLQVLEDRLDVRTLEAHRALHALGIDRAGSHPFFDRKVYVRVSAEALGHERESHPVLQMPVEHELSSEVCERLPRKTGETHVRVERPRVVFA